MLSYSQIYWIVGGLPKQHDRFYLKNVKNKIIKAYIIGKNVSFFKKQIANNIPYIVSNNIQCAVESVYKDLKSNYRFKKTILLSPAAASFDQFNNFEDRGESFKKLIMKKFKKD